MDELDDDIEPDDLFPDDPTAIATGVKSPTSQSTSVVSKRQEFLSAQRVVNLQMCGQLRGFVERLHAVATGFDMCSKHQTKPSWYGLSAEQPSASGQPGMHQDQWLPVIQGHKPQQKATMQRQPFY